MLQGGGWGDGGRSWHGGAESTGTRAGVRAQSWGTWIFLPVGWKPLKDF